MIKVFYFVFSLLFAGFMISCNNNQERIAETATQTSIDQSILNRQEEIQNTAICWKGTLNSTINIFLHYQIEGNLLIGELVYLDTKEKQPIKIIGTTERDESIRLLEFENSGNITGIITGTPTDSILSGKWFSPKTRKELDLELTKIDTIIKSKKIETNKDSIFGEYYYQYSQAGNQGTLHIEKIDQDKFSFSIFSVTGEPARNMADLEIDTLTFHGTNFIYKIPETDSCEFKVNFYKDFAYVTYTKGYCNGLFGHNATIAGIFYKQK